MQEENIISYCIECRVILSGKPSAYNVETGEPMCSSCADKVLGRKPHVVDALYLLEVFYGKVPSLVTKATCDCPKPSNHGRYTTTA